ncbi:signal peptidase I [Streptomyces sp. NPDC051064]|uniref:signal peptidase I n=1 Tax=Streptomyces sp. NPDC051064 TaxID=3365641 RepID=UPI0037904B05
MYAGRAEKDAALDRGWQLGHFRDPSDPRHGEALEISGRSRMRFPDRDVLLERQGDHVVWGRGVDHSWRAEDESVVLTVRRPSVPGYRVD